MTPSGPSWEEFTVRVAAITEAKPESVSRESRLVNDLDFDSLGLVELVVAMIGDYGLSVPDGLDAKRWEGLTAGQLYDAVLEGSLP